MKVKKKGREMEIFKKFASGKSGALEWRELRRKREEKEGAGRTGRGIQDSSARTPREGTAAATRQQTLRRSETTLRQKMVRAYVRQG